MKNQIICDRCGAIDKHWTDMTKGWVTIDDYDLCPKCVKVYYKKFNQESEKVRKKYQVEINTKCKDRDEALEIMFKTFLNTKK